MFSVRYRHNKLFAWLSKVIYGRHISFSCCRCSTFDQKVVDEEAFPVYQFVGENYKRGTLVFMWGYAEVGALGISRLVKPLKKSIRPKEFLHKPCRLPLSKFVKIKDLACGYGFTVFSDGAHVYGTGLNTDSQIGFHEARRNSGVGLERIIEPAMIRLPIDNNKCQVLDMSCGRAHTLILTNVYSPRVTVTRVYAGVHVSAAINSDGMLYTWGQPMYGSLGLAHKTKTQYFPFKVSLPAEAKHISIGVDHMSALCRSFA